MRLCGGQGWIPRIFQGSQYSVDIRPPDIRHGSFWFRVQSVDGVTVRTGPSSRAKPIKSIDDACFRFECGEFLRASEILTIHGHADVEDNDDNVEMIAHPSESFAKLYRHKKKDSIQQQHQESSRINSKQSFVPLASYISAGEWVHVHCNGNLYLEECVNAPNIKRNREGWEYEVIHESGVHIRKGPSFASTPTGPILQFKAIVTINEQVTSDGDSISWYRLKDGRGFIHSHGENGEAMVTIKTNSMSTQHRAKGKNDPSYKLIARLFQPTDLSSK